MFLQAGRTRGHPAFLIRLFAVAASSCILLLLAPHPTAAEEPAPPAAAAAAEPSSYPGRWNATWTDRLKKDLLTSYDKFVRPAEHTNVTVVSIDLTLRHVEMDELKAMMTVYCWVKMFWSDEKLKWNSSDYGGLSRLYIADHEIWQPDIVLYNSASGTEVDHYGNTHSIVHEDGMVLWVPPSLLRVFCDLDLRRWPFDRQTCVLRLGSWTYDGDQVDLQLDDTEAEMDLMVPNTQWEIVSMTRKRNVAFYSCCPEAYIDVTFTLTLQRRSPTYSALVIVPGIAIVMLTLLVFLLPPDAGEKILLGSCTALIVCLFLLFFSQMLPAMANHTPLIVTFYSISLVMVTISLALSVAVINMSRTLRLVNVPWRLKSALGGRIGVCLGLGNYIRMATAEQHGIMGHDDVREQPLVDEAADDDRHMIPMERPETERTHRFRPTMHRDWVLVAAALDRLALILYSLIFVIVAAAYV
ncbi:acetylcholine receptor subunit alpha-like 1 [Ischnura elegans]|uniref:acetylcholine receptor subunit alpha-like 1 n=1 Tax=Ischnura elegans TaxID=197161 RepID=UPI001ED867E4|nr:acetylcholine receptor subunit alpha-like 1 [Ischnura elegans]